MADYQLVFSLPLPFFATTLERKTAPIEDTPSWTFTHGADGELFCRRSIVNEGEKIELSLGTFPSASFYDGDTDDEEFDDTMDDDFILAEDGIPLSLECEGPGIDLSIIQMLRSLNPDQDERDYPFAYQLHYALHGSPMMPYDKCRFECLPYNINVEVRSRKRIEDVWLSRERYFPIDGLDGTREGRGVTLDKLNIWEGHIILGMLLSWHLDKNWLVFAESGYRLSELGEKKLKEIEEKGWHEVLEEEEEDIIEDDMVELDCEEPDLDEIEKIIMRAIRPPSAY